MKNYHVCFVLLIATMFSCQQKVEWISTTEQQSWNREEALNFSGWNIETPDVQINPDDTLQNIDGFGACFNELGWTSLSELSENDRLAIMKELFEPGTGANFTICRMPIGANDFSLDWYSYDETEGDFEMKDFSIQNDFKTLVPFIQLAQKYNPELQIWASPWSPPSWMKWNKHYACAIPWEGLREEFQNHLPADKQGKEGTNMFIQEDAYFKAYASYFGKFIDAYHQQGIRISMVMPQNEFNSCQIFPSCTWTAAGLATFIGEYLGPELEAHKVQIMFGTMERPAEALVDTILNDPEAGRYIKGVGFQWAGKEAITGIHQRYPKLKLYQSEQECGDGKNDWKYCNYAWTLMKHYLSNGTSAYMYWNISLNQDGFSRWGWQQNSLVTVDSVTNTFKFNHEYYLMKHISHFVKPGAKKLKTNGGYNDLLAFLNADRSIVIIVRNPLDEVKQVTIQINSKAINPVLKASSFNTFLVQL